VVFAVIKRLFFKNYRAFDELDIPLSKINLFFGPNNSGKSAILSALNVLSQTLDSTDRDVPLLLNGRFEDLGTYLDVVYNHSLERDISLGLEFDMELPPRIPSPRPSDLVAQDARIDVTFHYRKQRREIVVESIELSSPPGDILLSTRVAKTSNNQLIRQVAEDFAGVKTGTESSGSVILNHFMPSINPPLGRRVVPRISSRYAPYRRLDVYLYRFSRSLTKHLGNFEFIGPFRSGPQRLYFFSGETPSTVGVHGEKAIDILVADESRRRGKRLNIAQRISDWLRAAEIAKQIEVVVLTERHFELMLTHFETGEEANIADVGYGCSQILPILIAGYNVPRKSSLILAQPEIHLHPRAEAEVGSFLCEIARRDVQLFVETHSEHLLLRLQSHVAAGELSPQDVNVFYVYSDSRIGKKLYRRIPLGEDGFFTEEWPRGFFPEKLEEARKLAKFSIKSR
jgi:predicted ATPase